MERLRQIGESLGRLVDAGVLRPRGIPWWALVLGLEKGEEEEKEA